MCLGSHACRELFGGSGQELDVICLPLAGYRGGMLIEIQERKRTKDMPMTSTRCQPLTEPLGTWRQESDDLG